MTSEELFDNTVYLVRHGSRAYGTHLPESDTDEKGVAICPNPEYYFGFAQFEQKDKFEDGVDRVIYDIRKFIRLAADCNPNIIETLFVDETDILKMTSAGEILRNNARIFLSRKAANTFVGYASSQLHRMKNHHGWYTNPPPEPSMKNHTSFTSCDHYHRKFGHHEIVVASNFDFNLMHVDHEAFSAEKKRYEQYLNWKKDRNPARAALEEKHGYDCKHAMHLVRLLRMGKEIVEEGVVRVCRPDAAELLRIRNGEFSYEDILKEAETLRAEVMAAVEHSPLPEQPDMRSIEKLQMELIRATMRDI